MINNKEKKMIQRYCIYPKIAVVALIFSFVQCALIVPLEMIDDLVFQNKGFQPTGMFTASVSNPEILSYQAIPQQFKDEFLNGTFYKSFRFYDQDAPISLSCSFDTETEDQFDEYTRPKIHFFLGSK